MNDPAILIRAALLLAACTVVTACGNQEADHGEHEVRTSALISDEQSFGPPGFPGTSDFAKTVAVGGDTIAVGRPGTSRGAALMYPVNPSTGQVGSAQQLSISAVGAMAGDQWGDFVDLSRDGTRALACASARGYCAIFEDTSPGTTANGWTLAATFPGWSRGDLNGDAVILSSIQGTSNQVAIHERDPATGMWPLVKTYTGNNASGFGSSVAMGDGFALIGAPFDGPRSSTVYQVARNETTGVWETTRNILVSRFYQSAQQRGLGRSLALYGDRAAVRNGEQISIYDCASCRDGGVLLQSIPAPSTGNFGADIAVHGPYMAIGEPLYPSNPLDARPARGRVHLYTFDPVARSWGSRSIWEPSALATDDNFGADVDLSSQLRVVASANTASIADDGRVYFADAGPPGLADEPMAISLDFTMDENTTLTGNLRAVDADSSSLTYALATPPAVGTAVVDPSGSFTYTPPPNFFRATTPPRINSLTIDVLFSFTVSDGTYTSQPGEVGVAIEEAPDPPVFSNPADASTVIAFAGQPWQLTLQATDPMGGAIVYAATGLPAAASFDPNTGRISWTPTAADVGQYPISAQATSPAATASIDFTVSVVMPTPDPDMDMGGAMDPDMSAQMDMSPPVDMAPEADMAPAPDMGSTTADMGAPQDMGAAPTPDMSAADMGSGSGAGGDPPGSEDLGDEDPGCATSAPGAPGEPGMLVFALVSLGIALRRRTRSSAWT